VKWAGAAVFVFMGADCAYHDLSSKAPQRWGTPPLSLGLLFVARWHRRVGGSQLAQACAHALGPFGCAQLTQGHLVARR